MAHKPFFFTFVLGIPGMGIDLGGAVIAIGLLLLISYMW